MLFSDSNLTSNLQHYLRTSFDDFDAQYASKNTCAPERRSGKSLQPQTQHPDVGSVKRLWCHKKGSHCKY